MVAAVFIPIINRCEILRLLSQEWTDRNTVLQELRRKRKLTAAEQLNSFAMLVEMTELIKQGLVEERVTAQTEVGPNGSLPPSSQAYRLTSEGVTVKREQCDDDYCGCC